jgi:tryptophan-rich sensory protein
MLKNKKTREALIVFVLYLVLGFLWAYVFPIVNEYSKAQIFGD